MLSGTFAENASASDQRSRIRTEAATCAELAGLVQGKKGTHRSSMHSGSVSQPGLGGPQELLSRTNQHVFGLISD